VLQALASLCPAPFLSCVYRELRSETGSHSTDVGPALWCRQLRTGSLYCSWEGEPAAHRGLRLHHPAQQHLSMPPHLVHLLKVAPWAPILPWATLEDSASRFNPAEPKQEECLWRLRRNTKWSHLAKSLGEQPKANMHKHWSSKQWSVTALCQLGRHKETMLHPTFQGLSAKDKVRFFQPSLISWLKKKWLHMLHNETHQTLWKRGQGNIREGWTCSKHTVPIYGIITIKPPHSINVC
jgi:hypothetical protein